MENEELLEHIAKLKKLIVQAKYKEAVDYYVDNLYSNKNLDKKVVLESFLLKYINDSEPETIKELSLLLGMIQDNLNNYNDSLAAINQSIELDSKYTKAYNYRGNVYYSLEDYNIALDDYSKAIELDHNYSPAYNNRGVIYYKLGKYKKALKDYAKALSLDDNIPSTYNNRGNTYRNLKDYNNAIQDYEKAIALDPNYGLAFFNLGILYDDNGEYKKSLYYHNKHIELVSDQPWGYFQRGKIYGVLEDIDNAIKDFTKFSELIDDEYWKARALEKIEELQEEKENDDIKDINEYIETIKSTLLFEETYITHYTSITGAQILLLDTSSSFRMSEANYMNDTTEGEKLKQILFGKENYSDTHKISFIEKPFLASFVDDTKCNDLTLWRMYAKSDGIDGRGCAITMDKEELIAAMMETFIDEEYLKNNTDFSSGTKQVEGISTNEFGFYKVAYLNEEGRLPGRSKLSTNINKAIDGLKTSFENIFSKDDKELLEIALERLREIQYLFKGIEYQHESEVRLILSKTGKGKHIKVDTSEYFEVPRVYLNIGNILSSVSSITIGPKVERPKEWASAFNYNFLEKGMKDAKVYISRLPYK